MITVTNIYRHPVKSLTAEALLEAQLVPGRAIPNDRRFGLLLGSTPAAGAATEWMPKTKFLALVRNAKLAALETQFDDETDVLTVLRGGRQVACGKLTDRIGRISIEVFLPPTWVTKPRAGRNWSRPAVSMFCRITKVR
jgi:uncharacterized protein YcbX